MSTIRFAPAVVANANADVSFCVEQYASMVAALFTQEYEHNDSTFSVWNWMTGDLLYVSLLAVHHDKHLSISSRKCIDGDSTGDNHLE